MGTEILPNSCRICLKQSSKLTYLDSTEEYDETPKNMLFQLTGINLENDEEFAGVPKQICRNCICELNLAYQFRIKALEAQAKIDIYCKEPNINNSQTEEIDGKALIATNEFISNSNTFTNKLFEIQIEKFGEDFYPSHYVDVYTDSIPTTKSNDELIEEKFHVTSEKSAPNQHDCRVKSINKTLSKRGRKPLTTVPEKTALICDICGNMFSKRSRLTAHRQRHETELRHSCELCGERFLVHEELRRHMFHHVGEKPYKCNHCSRSFFYKSVKKTHEAVHAGLRPFKCGRCGRAFSYAHALRNHELIHADIKLYHCKYCNKDFRLQHHLKQHEQTALHKNTVKAVEKMTKNKI